MKILFEHKVGPVGPNTRLYDYATGRFAQLPSRKSVKKAMKRGALRLNGQPVESGRLVQPGDCIELVEQPLPEEQQIEIELDIVYEDEYLAVVHKPAGLLVNGYQKRTLEKALPVALQNSSQLDALHQPRPVHRLDKPTSGLVIIAKTALAHQHLSQQFEQRTVQKMYEAVVMGKPAQAGAIALSIGGKAAFTRFACLQTVPSLHSGQLSLLRLWPRSGRKHQLRRHLARLGYPILGDAEYGPQGRILKHKGLFLAALLLQFEHPVSKEKMDIEIERPHKFISRLAQEQRRFERFKLKEPKPNIND